MISDFDKREAQKYHSLNWELYTERQAAQSAVRYSFVSESHSGHSYVPSPLRVDSKMLEGEQLQETLDRSFESPSLFPSDDTFYVVDLSSHTETPYNSLMFQLHDSPLKSVETTKVIMDRYFASRSVPYRLMAAYGAMFGYTQCLPYVAGEACFVPDRGTSKQSASWHALHHVSHTMFDAAEKEVQLYSDCHHILTLPFSKETFDKQVDRAAHFYHIQINWMKDLLRNYKDKLHVFPSENVIHRRLKYTAYPFPDCSPYEFFTSLAHHYVDKNITAIMGESSPYAEDFGKKFLLPPRAY